MATENKTSKTKKIVFDWTSSTGGSASETTSFQYEGKVQQLITVPSTSAVPSSNYDITITDSDSIDILNAAGQNRSSNVTEYVPSSSLGYTGYSKLTLNVTNAGNAKAGKVILFVGEY